MTPEFVIGLAKESILAAASIAGPLLLFGMVMGIFVSLLQTVTQMQEQTLTFVPKLSTILVGFCFSTKLPILTFFHTSPSKT